MTGATLDAGALIAFERGQRSMVSVVVQARAYGDALAVPAGALAQVWRDGRRQARLARLVEMPMSEVVALDSRTARLAGQLCGIAGSHDVVDASVVIAARERGHRIMTSDPDDLRRLDASIQLVVV